MFSTLIIFLLVLGLLVFVHEFGHFITAKKSGIKVEEFGFGFPPRMAGIVKTDSGWKFVGKSKPTDKNFKNTIYSVNWIPLGGFVKIKGEGGEDADQPDSFVNKNIWKRALILFSGVGMNIVLTAVLLSIGFGVGMPRSIDDDISHYAEIKNDEMQIIAVVKNSPAKNAGVEIGDIILSVDEIVFSKLQGFSDYTNSREGIPLSVKLGRGGGELLKEITPIFLSEYNTVGLGIGAARVGIVSYPWYLAPWEGIKETGFFIKEIFRAFGMLIKNLVTTGEVAVDISGPVGIAVLTGQVARLGLVYLLQFTALLSVNLAIINFFPFPALDGGRLLFLLIEGIRRKPVDRRIENIIHNIGFTLLLLLVLLVTYRDFARFGGKIFEVMKHSFGS